MFISPTPSPTFRDNQFLCILRNICKKFTCSLMSNKRTQWNLNNAILAIGAVLLTSHTLNAFGRSVVGSMCH